MTRTAAERLCLERDAPLCRLCGNNAEGGSVHHRMRRNRPGADHISNLVLLCGSGTTQCHGWVHAHPNRAHDLGFILWSGEDPQQRPIISHQLGTMILLLPDGTLHVDYLIRPRLGGWELAGIQPLKAIECRS